MGRAHLATGRGPPVTLRSGHVLSSTSVFLRGSPRPRARRPRSLGPRLCRMPDPGQRSADQGTPRGLALQWGLPLPMPPGQVGAGPHVGGPSVGAALPPPTLTPRGPAGAGTWSRGPFVRLLGRSSVSVARSRARGRHSRREGGPTPSPRRGPVYQEKQGR